MDNLEIDNKYLENRDILFKILLYTIYISLICLILIQIPGICDFSIVLHEILYVELNFVIFIIPTELIILIYYSVTHFRQIRKVTSIKSMKYKFKGVLSLISIIFIFVYVYYIFHSFSSTGVFSNFRKTSEGSKYYIVINYKKIQCTKNEFNLIDTEKEYSIKIYWNKLNPNEGRLVSIKTIYSK